MASEGVGKNEIMRVTDDNRDHLLATTPYKDVCGIGHRLEKKLERMGIGNLYMLRFYTQQELEPLFGPFWSRQLLRMSQGLEPHHLQLLDDESHTRKPMQSVGRSITGYRTHSDEDEIKTVLRNLIEEVTHKVRQMDMAGRHVSLTLYGGAGSAHGGWGGRGLSQRDAGSLPTNSRGRPTFHRHQTLQYYIRHSQEMFDLIWHELYDPALRPREVIKFAVRLGKLRPNSEIPQSLLPKTRRQERISTAQDAINEKYGLFTLRPGSLLDHEIIRPEVTGFLGDRQYHGLS
jgi:nucleotidyltransferase/DNA polymerase involved in DNA repair